MSMYVPSRGNAECEHCEGCGEIEGVPCIACCTDRWAEYWDGRTDEMERKIVDLKASIASTKSEGNLMRARSYASRALGMVEHLKLALHEEGHLRTIKHIEDTLRSITELS